MDITGAAGSSIWRFLYGGGPSTGTNTLTPALTIGLEGSAAGRVGIGTTTPQQPLHVSNGGANGLEIFPGADGGTTTHLLSYNRSTSVYTDLRFDAQAIRFEISGDPKARIDSSGRLLVGTSTASSAAATGTPHIQAVGDYQQGSILLRNTSNDNTNCSLTIQKIRGSSIVQSGDYLGNISFNGYDGATDRKGADIAAIVDGTPGSGDLPCRLVFSTTADGASSPTERMRISQNGDVAISSTGTNDPIAAQINGTCIGATVPIRISRVGNVGLAINRSTNDGTLVEFYQDATQEGSISVSGTTVSYNGAHLSRWSQILGIDPHDKTDRPEILRGTVMSNLNEMCEWIEQPKEAVLWEEGEDLPEDVQVGDVKEPAVLGGPQDNEQLNKTKISDVEGDKNVAGVFQAWDDDDDTWVNDYYLAMTGDFVIRIAAGVTVQRGDLLMSAGDGTAKPQTDDAVRSCTIAKVTSTHICHTHPDGSYCVPCVLMAC